MNGRKIAAVLLAGVAVALPAALLAQAVSPPAAVSGPWMDKRQSPERRADLLLAAMSLDDKIALLHGKTAFPFGPIKQVPEGSIGSSGFVPGNPRLGIPPLQESDASMGVVNTLLVRGAADMSTALPSSLALAATFDPAMAYAGGVMIGEEARAKTINVQLAGGVNLARDPRNGRNFEYVGEDPLLAGIMTGEAVRGIQSKGVISTVKHFAVNGQETNRHAADSIIGEAAARESDLLAFEIAIERGQPGSVMCAYNLVNGTHACENEWLLNQVLKRDWGYKGYVMSDWGATHSVDAINAGLDQQSGAELDEQVWFGEPLEQAVRSGKVSQARVDDAVRRILRAMFTAGLFDRAAARREIDFPAHAEVARRQAEEGIVLLQNRGDILPLPATAKRIAVIGAHAESGVPSGMGSSQVSTPYNPDQAKPTAAVQIGGEGIMSVFGTVVFHPSSPLTALRARFKGAQVSFDKGIYPSSAAAAARDAEVAIVFVYQPSGEGEDVADMSLPFGQDQLVEAVAAANPHTVVVIESGNPVKAPWADKVGAILESWYSGSKGGEAIADVLTGKVNPSGRLPITWAADESQLPRPSIPGWGTPSRQRVKVDYTIEGSDVGYRWFARQNAAPRYWFGHGLSYTTFAYTGLEVKAGNGVTAQVTVKNTGAAAGKEVLQLYLTARGGKPIRRLMGFEKVPLAPGESRRVELRVDPRLLADFDVASQRWTIPGGRYDFALGRDAGTPLLRASATIKASTLRP